MSDATTRAPLRSPYVGPRAFVRGERLYGRDREIAEITNTLTAQRIVLLYSPSGAGKSSLLEAALRPRLEELEFDVAPTIRVGHEPPPEVAGSTVRNRYMLSTLLSLDQHRGDDALDPTALVDVGIEEYLREMEESGDETSTSTNGRRQDLCLFFDQFEELFTLDPTDLDVKREFLGEIGVALRNKGRWALFAMREDYIAQLDPYVDLFPTRTNARYRLDLLGVDAARVAMRAPAEAHGIDFEPDAADHLIDDLRRVRVQRGDTMTEELGPTVEPVQLQVVCSQLWNSLNA